MVLYIQVYILGSYYSSVFSIASLYLECWILCTLSCICNSFA